MSASLLKLAAELGYPEDTALTDLRERIAGSVLPGDSHMYDEYDDLLRQYQAHFDAMYPNSGDPVKQGRRGVAVFLLHAAIMCDVTNISPALRVFYENAMRTAYWQARNGNDIALADRIKQLAPDMDMRE
jgi:hypothetical protein